MDAVSGLDHRVEQVENEPTAIVCDKSLNVLENERAGPMTGDEAGKDAYQIVPVISFAARTGR